MIMDKKGEKLFTIETRDIKQTTHENVRKVKPSEFAENILLMGSKKLCCHVSERLNKIIVISTGPTLALRQSEKSIKPSSIGVGFHLIFVIHLGGTCFLD